MASLLLLIPLLPFLGFLINGLGRNFLPKGAVSFVGCATVLGSFILSILFAFRLDELLALNSIGGNAKAYIATYFNFINVGNLNIPFTFQIDQLTTIFLLIITGVGFLIHVYSTAYMHEEERPHFARYFSYLNLFVFSMLLLVLGA